MMGGWKVPYGSTGAVPDEEEPSDAAPAADDLTTIRRQLADLQAKISKL